MISASKAGGDLAKLSSEGQKFNIFIYIFCTAFLFNILSLYSGRTEEF